MRSILTAALCACAVTFTAPETALADATTTEEVVRAAEFSKQIE